ncbi:hypothetical protein OSB04_012776 [Centaurea solstitialis]|uniref:CCHC-type domain-containing protein n=1 Tax=Centaurea solstitialis TaxID=347529 RepID=A0AA38TV20_9ASTR|nr:hypothetical protein OSB04_012776 [Centaurea solstitialis]
MANTVTNTNNLSLRSILEKDKLTGPNFLDWERNLQIVLRHERKWYVLEEPLGEAPPANASTAIRNAYQKRSDDLLDVGCLMLATMSPELQTGLMNTNAYDMIRQLRDMFQTQARTERYDATRALNACKMAKGTSVSAHVMKMKRLLDHLERLGHPVPLQLATDTILNSLSDDYKQFVMNFNMNNMERSIAELHSMLKTAEQSMGTGTKTKDVLMVRDGGVKKKRGQRNTSKGKDQVQVNQSVPKAVDNRKGKGKGKKVKVNKAKTENRCFRCHEVGHWRQNCPKRHETVCFSNRDSNQFGPRSTKNPNNICHAWERVFDISETLYRELIVEFVATFRFDAIKALGEFHQSCMTFRLGGVWRSLSLVDFALALGIYTQLDVDTPGFEEYMWATAKRPDDFDPRLAWAILGDGDYHGNLKVKGFIASTDRLLHRMLIQAVNARSSSEEKVTVQDLWLLEHLSTDDKYPNAPYLIAAQLAKASGYREGSRIVGGQYVTLLAKHFGILTDAVIASMTNLEEMGLIDMDQLRGMGVARVEHATGRDYNAWIRNPQAYGGQPRSQPSRTPRSTHETRGTSGASSSRQPADWTAYSGYQDLSNQLSEMSLSYGRHQQHMEYNTVEALHQANWQSGVMNQMASHFGIQPNTAFAPSPYWPYSEDAPPGYPTYEDWQNQPRGPY